MPSLKELLEKMADSLGANPQDITPAFFSIARGLIQKGYLLPELGEVQAGGPSSSSEKKLKIGGFDSSCPKHVPSTTAILV